MLFVVVIMTIAIFHGLVLYMVSASRTARWTLKAAATACIFAVVGTALPAWGFGECSPIPFAIGSIGMVLIAAMMIRIDGDQYIEGKQKLARAIGERIFYDECNKTSCEMFFCIQLMNSSEGKMVPNSMVTTGELQVGEKQ